MIQNIPLSPQQQARVIASGVLLIMFLGMSAAVGVVIAALWALAQLLILATESILDAARTLATLYQSSGPFIQFCLLVALGYAMYRAGQFIHARRVQHARI
jgi:hypothetical protein